MTAKMPLRIDTGFRLATGTDPFEFAAQVRALLDPIRDRLDAAWLAEYATGLVDEARFGNPRPAVEDPKQSWLKGVDPYARPLTTAALAWADEQSRHRPSSVWHDPHYFEMSLGRDPLTGRIVGQHYCARSELRDAFEAMPQVEDFTFRTFVDELPDGVTRAEWDDRGRVWETLCPGFGPAILSGLSLAFKLRTPDTEVEMTRLASGPDLNPLILDNLPTEQHRAWRLLSPAMIGMLAPKSGDTAGILAAYHRAARIAEGKLQPVIDLLEPVTTDDLNGVRRADPARADTLHVGLQTYAEYLVGHDRGEDEQ